MISAESVKANTPVTSPKARTRYCGREEAIGNVPLVMKPGCPALVLGLSFVLTALAVRGAEPIARTLPPAGIEISPADRTRLRKGLEELQAALEPHTQHPLFPDAAIFSKAVEFALRHGEFYQPHDIERSIEMLKHGADRGRQLASGSTPWTRQSGRVVRGFRSRIDDSIQPYGLVISESIDFEKRVPLYVWLHGRGDKQTDMHFIHERLTRDGQIKPPGAIVLHPFGRHCLGFKSAGEIDVLEAIADVQKHYRIDPDRVVLIGFSMGGAGAWHIGAHYTDHFVAVSPGAGFAETARYTNLEREDYPAKYEQQLWGVYDVPHYVRNLFNRPVIAYSGELDKQIQAARVMEAAFREQGRELTHIVGPGMGHEYHPESLDQIVQQLAAHVRNGRPESPASVSLQTRTLRYSRMDWLEVLRLERHWEDTRVDAQIAGPRRVRLTTRNVVALRLATWPKMNDVVVEIDGQVVTTPDHLKSAAVLARREGAWSFVSADELDEGLSKRPGLQGPIDDVFLEEFLVVVPSGRARNEQVQNWVEAELDHFRTRWAGVFRGDVRVKTDKQVTDADIARFHMVVWGTPDSNELLRRIFDTEDTAPPVKWKGNQIVAGDRSWPAGSHVPVLIYPHPLNPQRYLVVNSGPTFREAHDRTNSLQNPKLPDWAVIDLAQPPSATSPGRIAAAGFFDEHWQLAELE